MPGPSLIQPLKLSNKTTALHNSNFEQPNQIKMKHLF